MRADDLQAGAPEAARSLQPLQPPQPPQPPQSAQSAQSKPAPLPRPWPLPRLVRLSLVLHVALLAALLLAPQQWRWQLALLFVNHLLIAVVGLWPRSTWLGENLLRLPPAACARGDIALTIDDGPDALVTPMVLDLLALHGARATFFCIGKQAALHPALCREILARGHALENHSQSHRHDFSLRGPGGMKREIETAQRTLHGITGEWPQFFRAPAGLRNPFLAPVLCQLGLRLASWTRRGFDTRCGDANTVNARLLRGLSAGDILLLHDGHGARTPQGVPVIVAALPGLLQAGKEAGLRFVTLPQAFDMQAGSARFGQQAALP
ncbi:MAG: polysaccharide deacetylase family protein [Janthinobacterium lividum]